MQMNNVIRVKFSITRRALLRVGTFFLLMRLYKCNRQGDPQERADQNE
jgi:hypothetical protein